MRNPPRTRNLHAALFLLGLGCFVAALALPEQGEPVALRYALGGGGFFFAAWFGTLAAFAHPAARRYEHMRRGEGIVARWTVDPARWATFQRKRYYIHPLPNGSFLR